MHVNGSLISEFINTITNILLFTIIPLIWYLTKEKTFRGFIHSLGIYKPRKINLLSTFFIVTVVYLITLMANATVILTGNSGRNLVDIKGYSTIELCLYLLLYGIKTGIAEEIFFRGFIAKKLIKRFGFSKGNVVQAIVFAIPHFVIMGTASTVDIIVRIINAFLLGYLLGYIMDKKADGSIIPCMISHILINIVSSIALAMIL
ncbi:CPBP family intramembrane glutamic endopeptidase [Tissierella sp. MB52-C2]|uniref:CPBP family intramembrane glutamic endopeptidase n=1 Tax=Tissierella sp. MB52-C2 TaxID=3070999 RepID=UPI00280BB7E7|nr:CPBP family intramembrane glutamic endopeptidase [Tissierella sp. MB52-C2]WMM24017.1 CPBP family intramembrane glutamic endopeptidase [Tissierella sp. MB52-C2]